MTVIDYTTWLIRIGAVAEILFVILYAFSVGRSWIGWALITSSAAVAIILTTLAIRRLFGIASPTWLGTSAFTLVVLSSLFKLASLIKIRWFAKT